MSGPANILVLGAYGLIGSAVCRRLIADGHAVTGLGRSAGTAAQALPGVPFVARDLTALCEPAAWDALLTDIDLVVNCAGALQDGGRDDLDAVHHRMLAALAQAAAPVGIVQVSAVGVAADAATDFLRSKARGDAAIRASGKDWWILRPGLVIGQGAYGGTALLRMLAAFPVLQPLAYPHAPVQTVAIDDVADAAARCARREIPVGTEADLVEEAPQSLAVVVAAYRRWLGFAPARTQVVSPEPLTRAAALLSDGLGRFGWRSPLRTTAMTVMRDGVRGDPGPWRALTGAPLRPLRDALAAHPAHVQDRWHARLALLAPAIFATLALFWLLSGLIGLWRIDAAAAVLARNGWSVATAQAAVALWAVVDIALGLGMLWRRWAGRAIEGMILVSALYLLGGALFAPELWADPLGPMLKVFPALMLALVARVLLEAR